ncbi:MAG TPA: polyribonucleotide nucleotidyltransferase [Nitriliruptorales bacterium]
MGALGNISHSTTVGKATITFEGGKLAQQAGGSVVASIGDTTILTTTTTSGGPKEHLGFFPLTIEVEERMYAAGRIPGSFFKREGRPSEGAILTCRLTDRPLRPTFDDGLRNEVQVVNTILQTTQEDPYDVLAINASSCATMLAGVPFNGPVGAVRYAMLRDGSWVAFPTFAQLEDDAVFDLVAAGRVDEDGDVAILMVEADATPHSYRFIQAGAQAPTEAIVGQALEDIKPIIRQLCEAQQAFVEKLGARPRREFPLFLPYTDAIYDLVEDHALKVVQDVYGDHDMAKDERTDRLSEAREAAVAHAVDNGPDDLDEGVRSREAKEAFRSVEKKVVRRMIVEDGIRIDGRGARDLRPVSAEVGLLPRTHGSGFFQRGDTNALTVLALGSMRDAQRLDTLLPDAEKRYMHHYNFPPFSVGETGRVGSPKRREIGHGALAERAVLPVVPTEEEWPYAIRLVSEITSSNGSTSMASVCGSTLALMDGGVPIYAPVAGIAMGLIKEGETFVTLTDIQGTEDFYGDMDFKVAGTRDFITALQLDTKLSGIGSGVLGAALEQAREARLQILDVMTQAIAEPRAEVAAGAPRVQTIYIPMSKIGEVIGPKGKIIREITEETGAQIDVDDDGSRGVVRIYADSKEAAESAAQRVNNIANPVIPKVGERYHATVVKTESFGAFVNLTPGTDGLLHISKLSQRAGRRFDHAEEAINVGDKVWIEILEVLDGGRKFKLDFVEDDEPQDDEPQRDQPQRDEPQRDEVVIEAETETEVAQAEVEQADAGDVTTDEPSGEGGGRSRARRDRDRGGDDGGASQRTRTRTRSRSRE